jgi:hypothetical protein
VLITGFWSLLLGIGMTFRENLIIQLTVSILLAFYMTALSHLCFLPVRSVEGKGRGQLKPGDLPSSLLPLFQYPRAIPAPLAIIGGVYLAGMLIDYMEFFQRTELWDYVLLAINTNIGVLFAIAFGFGTDTVVARRPGQYAVLAAASVSIILGLIFPWFIALFVGSLIGSIVGTLMERKQMQMIEKENFEKIVLKEAKVIHTGLLKPSDLSGGKLQDVTLTAASEKYEAWGGEQRGHKELTDSVWKGCADPACKPALQPEPSEQDVDEDAETVSPKIPPSQPSPAAAGATVVSPTSEKDASHRSSPKHTDTSPLSQQLAVVQDTQSRMVAYSPTAQLREGDSPPPGPSSLGRTVVAAPPRPRPGKKYTMQNAAKKTRRMEPPPPVPAPPPAKDTFDAPPRNISPAGTRTSQGGASPKGYSGSPSPANRGSNLG